VTTASGERRHDRQYSCRQNGRDRRYTSLASGESEISPAPCGSPSRPLLACELEKQLIAEPQTHICNGAVA
jgi:hypothetical protein